MTVASIATYALAFIWKKHCLSVYLNSTGEVLFIAVGHSDGLIVHFITAHVAYCDECECMMFQDFLYN